MPKLFKYSTHYPCCQRFATIRIIRGRVIRLPLWKTPKVRQPL
jgi:hypothetical protein